MGLEFFFQRRNGSAASSEERPESSEAIAKPDAAYAVLTVSASSMKSAREVVKSLVAKPSTWKIESIDGEKIE